MIVHDSAACSYVDTGGFRRVVQDCRGASERSSGSRREAVSYGRRHAVSEGNLCFVIALKNSMGCLYFVSKSLVVCGIRL